MPPTAPDATGCGNSHTWAVVFDLDDTLYAERSFALSGLRAVAATFVDELHAPFDLEAAMVQLFDTQDRGRVFNVIMDRLGIDDGQSIVDRMIHAFRTHTPSIALHPDADRALNRYAGRYRLGLISDGFLATQKAKVQALGLTDRIDHIILTDQWGRQFWKPHPRAFEDMAANLGVEHEHCAFVADNRAKDFVAPNNLGWLTVCVDRPGAIYRNATAPSGGEPDRVVGSLDELVDCLQASPD